eukprot:4222843-Pyramimonas_sp.AAC.1
MVASGSQDILVPSWIQEHITFDAACEFERHNIQTGLNLHEEEPKAYFELVRSFVKGALDEYREGESVRGGECWNRRDRCISVSFTRNEVPR